MTASREAIRAGEVLLLTDFLERTNNGRAAWRTLRRNAGRLGITLDYRSGRQAYVDTDRWLEFLRRQPELREVSR